MYTHMYKWMILGHSSFRKPPNVLLAHFLWGFYSLIVMSVEQRDVPFDLFLKCNQRPGRESGRTALRTSHNSQTFPSCKTR